MSNQRSPHLTRFLSDFTLGFSDGLTVPFALTAGLGSLGHAETVIYAGLAELCAGSISMGIGGYLAALDDLPASTSTSTSSSGSRDDADVEEMTGMLNGSNSNDEASSVSSGSRSHEMLVVDEKGLAAREDAGEETVRCHLEPLQLPGTTIAGILSALRDQPGGLRRAAATVREHNDSQAREMEPTTVVWPVVSGLSISMGYVIGGIIPLLPYFFASGVDVAGRWSIGLCLAALFVFGAGKSWLLRGRDATVRRCLWEGVQMLALGALAALAAVLAVNLVNGGGGDNKTEG